MWWRNPLRIAAVLALGALNAACFQPLYASRSVSGGTPLGTALAQIQLEPIPAANGTPEARIAVELQNQLDFELNGRLKRFRASIECDLPGISRLPVPASGPRAPFSLVHGLDPRDRDLVTLGDQINRQRLGRGHPVGPGVAPTEQIGRRMQGEVGRRHGLQLVPFQREGHGHPRSDARAVGADHGRAAGSGRVEEHLAVAVLADEGRGRQIVDGRLSHERRQAETDQSHVVVKRQPGEGAIAGNQLQPVTKNGFGMEADCLLADQHAHHRRRAAARAVAPAPRDLGQSGPGLAMRGLR